MSVNIELNIIISFQSKELNVKFANSGFQAQLKPQSILKARSILHWIKNAVSPCMHPPKNSPKSLSPHFLRQVREREVLWSTFADIFNLQEQRPQS